MHSEMFVSLPVFEGCFKLVLSRYFDCLQSSRLSTRKYALVASILYCVSATNATSACF